MNLITPSPSISPFPLSPAQIKARKDVADHGARLLSKLRHLQALSQNKNRQTGTVEPVSFVFSSGQSLTVAPGLIQSDLHDLNDTSGPAAEYNAAIDGFESLVLAMATAGVDMGTAQMRQAVETAAETIAQQFA